MEDGPDVRSPAPSRMRSRLRWLATALPGPGAQIAPSPGRQATADVSPTVIAPTHGIAIYSRRDPARVARHASTSSQRSAQGRSSLVPTLVARVGEDEPAPAA